MNPSAFDRQVFLIQPPPTSLNADGEMEPVGDAVRHEQWAYWKELPGSETYSEQQEFGLHRVEITLWWSPSLAAVDTTWSVEGEDGIALDIVSVVEAVPGKRNWQIKITAISRA